MDPENDSGREMKLVPITELEPRQGDQFRLIYEEAFPVRQREPFENFVREDSFVVSRVCIANDVVVGILVWRSLSCAPWTFLEYFAVAPTMRSQGAGTLMWSLFRSQLTASRCSERVVFEVEDPEAAPNLDEERQRRRRIAFYERVAARRLPVRTYVVPDVQGDGVEPLLLYGSIPNGQLPRGRELEDLVRALYVEGYGLAPDHELARAAVGSVSGDGEPLDEVDDT